MSFLGISVWPPMVVAAAHCHSGVLTRTRCVLHVKSIKPLKNGSQLHVHHHATFTTNNCPIHCNSKQKWKNMLKKSQHIFCFQQRHTCLHLPLSVNCVGCALGRRECFKCPSVHQIDIGVSNGSTTKISHWQDACLFILVQLHALLIKWHHMKHSAQWWRPGRVQCVKTALNLFGIFSAKQAGMQADAAVISELLEQKQQMGTGQTSTSLCSPEMCEQASLNWLIFKMLQHLPHSLQYLLKGAWL